ncbi:hypothetical protein CONLIGDRAFT_640462 [Coniochaeta ligniaria NRRL 30616]|uniref:Proteophosphoglycan 5 n=1 Tax=Coniochaeta ligniaria NRRL 30616 TaxID=1408157 RepID=A0A1J7JIW5_9PEZI|nr:hypothetical protein CONLIGDRAFT_640462 [Coniochaeta ligniaria NRRL 30616]
MGSASTDSYSGILFSDNLSTSPTAASSTYLLTNPSQDQQRRDGNQLPTTCEPRFCPLPTAAASEHHQAVAILGDPSFARANAAKQRYLRLGHSTSSYINSSFSEMLPQHSNSPAHKATPSRRRQNRPPSTRSPASKTYASESDMPSELPFPIEMPNGSGSPFATPQKSASNSPAPQPQSQSVNVRPKARNGNKPRPKSGFAPPSPGPVKQSRRTPPNAVPGKLPTATAFAGATFHASPAPSSLPIPSFLAKAMDSPQVKDSGRANQQPSPPLSESEAPTPRQASVLAREVTREESPLDFFFNKVRDEKEQARRASFANAPVYRPGPYSPPNNHVQSPPQPKTVPNKPPTILSRRDLHQRNSSAGRISPTELDGTPGRPMGPAFSTPYNERMRAARSGDKQAASALQQAPDQGFTHQPPAADVGDRTEALKRFLAVGSPSPPAPSQTAPENNFPAGMVAQRLFGGPAPRPQQQPYVPQPTGDSMSPRSQSPRSQDLQRVEEGLRRILKLESGGTTLSS